MSDKAELEVNLRKLEKDQAETKSGLGEIAKVAAKISELALSALAHSSQLRLGSFRVTISSEPKDLEPNHLRLDCIDDVTSKGLTLGMGFASKRVR